MPELMLLKCMCGAKMIGTEADYDAHLKIDCPVFKEAQETLNKKYA